MPFRILAWELQTKLVREAKCVSGNFEEAGSLAGSQSFRSLHPLSCEYKAGADKA